MASIRLEVGVSIRKTIEKREEKSLSEFACLASASQGREKPEELDQVRTCFQRDRDRILHSKSFRRLKHKTQVFIAPQGDHFRTRLTHSLEVAQISRTVGRALCLNEDLIEAIALGHDVGHTPFGHAGEQAIDDALKNELAGIENNPGRFRHYQHSLRIVDVLEDLNLSAEVREGISGHSKGRSDLSEKDGEVTSTLEASVVRICDRIAYLNHDLDDAIRAGVLTSVPDSFLALGSSHGKRISAMVIDVIENSLDQPLIKLSPNMLCQINELKELLFKEVYLKEPNQSDQVRKAKRLVKELLCYYSEPGHLPNGFSGIQGAIDYVAGMTDRFAIRKYTELFVPMEFQEVVALIR